MNDETKDVGRLLLFPNRDKTHENSPDYMGRINIQGRWYKLSAWENQSKKDEMYISGTLGDEWEERKRDVPTEETTDEKYHHGGAEDVPSDTDHTDFDDEIPF